MLLNYSTRCESYLLHSITHYQELLLKRLVALSLYLVFLRFEFSSQEHHITLRLDAIMCWKARTLFNLESSITNDLFKCYGMGSVVHLLVSSCEVWNIERKDTSTRHLLGPSRSCSVTPTASARLYTHIKNCLFWAAVQIPGVRLHYHYFALRHLA